MQRSKENMRPSFGALATLLAMAALPTSTGFMAPPSASSLQLQVANGAFCKASMPVAGMMQRKQKAAIMGLKMELVGKRYWLWNLSEWCFDRIIALAQVYNECLRLAA